jgi:hypothetical protein
MKGIQNIAMLVLTFCVSTISFSQHQVKLRQLSKYERRWVITHPFLAVKAKRCAERTKIICDSLERKGVLSDSNGGQLDAFRHIYWMYLLRTTIRPDAARKLGVAHEKGNYHQFKKGRLEDGARPDSLGSVMDEKNNQIGLQLAADSSISKSNVIDQILKVIWNGDSYIIKKNAQQQRLSCAGTVVDYSKYKLIWNLPGCLVKSNDILVPH